MTNVIILADRRKRRSLSHMQAMLATQAAMILAWIAISAAMIESQYIKPDVS